jgi:hypothetical protein
MLDRFNTPAVAAILPRMTPALSRPTIFQPAMIKQDAMRDRNGLHRQYPVWKANNGAGNDLVGGLEMDRLDGKVALITGSGTGRATARAMAANGAKVVVAEINAAAGEQTAQIISQVGGHCIAIKTDVSQEDTVRAAIETAVRRLWRVAHPPQQCGWIDPGGQHGRRGSCRGILACDSTGPVRNIPRVPLRHTGDHRLGWGIGHQHGVECGVDGR